jgi:hypothetical protein
METRKLYGVSLDGYLRLRTWLHRHQRNEPTSPLTKGTIVPDLQSELKKLETLAFDDEGSTTEIIMTLPQAFQPTNNVSRETFDFIKEHPGLTRLQIAKAMEDRGFKRTSALALASQFARQGMIRNINGGLHATMPEYVPVKSSRTLKSAKVAKVTDKKVKGSIIPPTPQPVIDSDTSAKALLSRMSILQAREVYDELKKIFAS